MDERSILSGAVVQSVIVGYYNLPAENFTFRVGGAESRLFPQQLDREGVSRNHNHHWNVKGDQGAIHEELFVVDGAHILLRYNVLHVNGACEL